MDEQWQQQEKVRPGIEARIEPYDVMRFQSFPLHKLKK